MATDGGRRGPSAKQIAANRRNSLRSTGPRSRAGKAIAARNALRHGMCAAETPVIRDEDAGTFRQFHRQVSANLAPHGAVEVAMVERIATLQWRLARAGRIEAAIFAVEQARRTKELAETRVKEKDPGLVPDWRLLKDHPPPPTRPYFLPTEDDPPHVVKAVKDWNAKQAAYDKAVTKRDVAREQFRSMTDAGTLNHIMQNPQALETLTRYEITLYRQLEDALRQYWMTVGRRTRSRPPAPEIESEIVQDLETLPPANDRGDAPIVNDENASD